MCHDIFHFRVHLLVIQMSFLWLRLQRLLPSSAGNALPGRPRYEASSSFSVSLKDTTSATVGLCLGQRTGLVKDDRIGVGNCLQELAALDRNLVAGLPHGLRTEPKSASQASVRRRSLPSEWTELLLHFWSADTSEPFRRREYGTRRSARCSALLSRPDFSFSDSSIMATIFS